MDQPIMAKSQAKLAYFYSDKLFASLTQSYIKLKRDKILKKKKLK